MQAIRNATVNAILKSRMLVLIMDIEFMNYSFVVDVTGGGEVVLQGVYKEPDTYTRKEALQYTRRWVLSPYMTDSELVATAFKCCITSMEHRTREAFKYKKARIFGPHFHVDDLVRLCVDEQRDNAGGRVEA